MLRRRIWCGEAGFCKQARTTAPDSYQANWTMANLVFDSFGQPLAAGVRSAALSAWQVVYEAEV